MSKIIYSLYSENKKRIILTIQKQNLTGELYDKDGCIRIVTVTDGSGCVSCENGESESFSSGDCFMFDNGKEITISCPDEAKINLVKFNLSDFIDGSYRVFDKKILEKFLHKLENNAGKLRSVHINTKKIQEAFFMIENEFENRNSSSEYVIKAYMALILSLVVQYYSDDFGGDIKRSTHYKDIERTLVYINENIAEKITLDELSAIANMSKTSYSVAFKKATGMTVWEYILNARVELASSYLIEKKANVTEVALMCGFNNTAHFSKIFKKIKGSTPSEFKKESVNPCF